MNKPFNFESKKLIAEFMECEVHETYHSPTYSDYSVKGEMVLEFRKKGFRTYGFEDKMMFDNMCFDTSFDWLMEVVGKIEKEDFGFKICRKVVEIYRDSTKEILLKTKEKCKIDSLFIAIVEFIKWYNQNESKKNL